MRNQIILFLRSDEEIFSAKQIFYRAAVGAEILVYKNVADYLIEAKTRFDSPLLCLTDSIRFIGPLVSDFKERGDSENLPPILLLCDDIDPEELQDAYAAGIAGFIPSPLKLELNLRRMQNYFDLLQIPLQVWPYCHIPTLSEDTPEDLDSNIWWELH
ncbi:MAG: hypothetical protein DWQ05_15645 [Calditrichaeota bacterium]|nr:MAG: hypothetical protein DWQ05_15645 [Calditrichota bacterium]